MEKERCHVDQYKYIEISVRAASVKNARSSLRLLNSKVLVVVAVHVKIRVVSIGFYKR